MLYMKMWCISKKRKKEEKKKGLFSIIFYFFHILDYLAANTAQLLHPKEKIRSNI